MGGIWYHGVLQVLLSKTTATKIIRRTGPGHVMVLPVRIILNTNLKLVKEHNCVVNFLDGSESEQLISRTSL